MRQVQLLSSVYVYLFNAAGPHHAVSIALPVLWRQLGGRYLLLRETGGL